MVNEENMEDVMLPIGIVIGCFICAVIWGFTDEVFHIDDRLDFTTNYAKITCPDGHDWRNDSLYCLVGEDWIKQ